MCQDHAPHHEETIVLSVLDGPDALYLASRPGSAPIGVNYRIGLRLPASCTATGKAMLSTLSDAEVRALYPPGSLLARTTSSITNLDRLLEELNEARARGYALDDEETSDGMYCVGAPVFAQGESRSVAGIAFSLVKARLDEIRAKRLSEEVVSLGRTLSERLGAASTQADRYRQRA
jgi:DNA-binding IclR family transcriptional regulator